MLGWEERIERVKKAFSIKSNRQLEERLGIGNGYINDLIKGKNKNPSKIAAALVLELRINPMWLENENLDMFEQTSIEKPVTSLPPLMRDLEEYIKEVVSDDIQRLNNVETRSENRLTEIEDRLARLESRLEKQKILEGNFTAEAAPEYDWETEKVNKIPFVYDIAAGPPIAQSEDQSETIAVPIRLMRKGVQYYAATVRGGSMEEAGIRDGDLVLIRCTNVPRDGAIQVVRYQDKSTLKLLREVEGKGWELHYRDGTGRVITCDSNEYETQGEFEAIITKKRAKKPGSK